MSSLKNVDLHVHLRGTMTTAMARTLASRNQIHVPNRIIEDEEYQFQGFQDFLNIYDSVGRVIRTADDLQWIAQHYLQAVAAEGTGYVEFMLSPDHSEENGIRYVDQLQAIDRAVAGANDNGADVGAKIIVTAVRHKGADAAMALAEKVAAYPNRLVVGFGLTGNELFGRARDFEGAFLVAGQCGLGLTAHIGEWSPPAMIVEAVERLQLKRIGHGIRAVEDIGVLKRLVDLQVGFEVCPSSNIRLGAATTDNYPLRTMIDHGCKVAICTDDPAHFSTTPAKEWELAGQLGRLTAIERDVCLRDSVEMAFCDEKTKSALLQRAPP